MTHPDRLDGDGGAELEQILTRRHELASTADLVRGFATMNAAPRLT